MTQQLGFESALVPEKAIQIYWDLIRDYDRAVVAGDKETAMAIRNDASRLVVNGGFTNCDTDVLQIATGAPKGAIPKWGQRGDFVIDMTGLPVRIQMEGMLGVSASEAVWPGFGARAVDPDRPYFSQTGYRSFLRVRKAMVPGLKPDAYAREIITSHIEGPCHGRLQPIREAYRSRF